MKLNDRLQKLREEKKLLIESIKQAEAKASIQQRKRETRARIILGGAILGLPGGEREALLTILLPRLTERDGKFVSDFLAGGQQLGFESPRSN